MNIYFAGIGGVAIGPLAEIAHDCGYHITGSDPHEGHITRQLQHRGITFSTDQSGDYLAAQHQHAPIDWFVYSSALSSDHPEVERARQLNIPHIVKRDEFINHIIKEKNLSLIAVAGTHGKTTTTAMLVWVFTQLNIPVSYSIGSTITFGPSGCYTPESQYFIYECDEYDRNFLSFSPELSLVTSIDYDHPDIYPTQEDYNGAFTRFLQQSRHTILWQSDTANITAPQSSWVLQSSDISILQLPGKHNRANASLVLKACEYLGVSHTPEVQHILEQFPGSARRFERLADNLYTDYGHHPSEIAATLQLASELSEHIVLVYQPHQNTRQHQIRDEYATCMEGAETIYWLSTYLTREDPDLAVLTPETLIATLTNRTAAHPAQLDDALWQTITDARHAGKLVLCMGAGDIDEWLRRNLAT